MKAGDIVETQVVSLDHFGYLSECRGNLGVCPKGRICLV